MYVSAANGSSQGAAQDVMLERVLTITGLFLEAVLCLGVQSELIRVEKLDQRVLIITGLFLEAVSAWENSQKYFHTKKRDQLRRAAVPLLFNGVSRQSREAAAARAQVGGRTPCMGQYNTCCVTPRMQRRWEKRRDHAKAKRAGAQQEEKESRLKELTDETEENVLPDETEESAGNTCAGKVTEPKEKEQDGGPHPGDTPARNGSHT